MYCTIIPATWEKAGHAPALICEDGILLEPSQWLQELAKDGKSQSLLEKYAYGLQRYYDFWRHYSIAFKGDDLLRAFWKAMRRGDVNLGWEQLKQKTAEGYLTGVNLFTDWLSDRNGTENPNPLREEKAPWVVLLAHYDRRRKTDLLFHLYHNTKEGRGLIKTRRLDVASADARRMRGAGKIRPQKIFALQNFHKLLAEERSPRNLILWLLLGPGGMRISEALHLFGTEFETDVFYDPKTKEAKIRLADPRDGKIVTTSLGEEKKMSREAFLRLKYNMVPRDQLSKRDTLWAGWKGMKAHDPETETAGVIWIHSFYGQMMWAAHLAYMKDRAMANPQHPWYLVNLSRNVGEPLTYKNAVSLLKNACKRLHLPPPHNLHSLRHLYGDLGANYLKLDLQDIQVGLRQSCILSTMIYTEPSAETARQQYRAARERLK